MEARHAEDGDFRGERSDSGVEESTARPDAYISPAVDFLLLFALTLLVVLPLLVLL